MLQTEQLRNLLVLHRASGVGLRTMQKLLAKFSSVEEILRADTLLLRNLGLSEEIIAGIKQPDWQAIERDLVWASRDKQSIIAFTDLIYPILLKEIVGAPLVMFVKGDAAILHDPQLAVVGSRNPTATGKENAYAFAKCLVATGVTITSGLALGIDTAGHRGALDGGGHTIAVMGAGLDYLYPKRNIKLAEEIVAGGGALVSEFPLGVAPTPLNFPQRNRIISGLSLGTLVVEAALHSGSLITANFALEQGREVFAIPGSIHNPLARGCHGLLRQGAKLVESVSDILEELLPLVTGASNPHIMLKEEITGVAAVNKLDSSLQKLLNCLGDETTSIDMLLERSKLTIGEITTMLVTLEMSGYIKNVPGGYVRVCN